MLCCRVVLRLSVCSPVFGPRPGHLVDAPFFQRSDPSDLIVCFTQPTYTKCCGLVEYAFVHLVLRPGGAVFVLCFLLLSDTCGPSFGRPTGRHVSRGTLLSTGRVSAVFAQNTCCLIFEMFAPLRWLLAGGSALLWIRPIALGGVLCVPLIWYCFAVRLTRFVPCKSLAYA